MRILPNPILVGPAGLENLQPDRYERSQFTGKIEKIEVIWYVTARLILTILARYRRFTGNTQAVVSAQPASFFENRDIPDPIPRRATRKICFAGPMACIRQEEFQ
jgi:hypothetical protein